MENVVNAPLSGEEIQQVIVNKVREALKRNQRLLPYLAFASFSFKAEIVILLGGVQNSELVQPVIHSISGSQGATVDPDAEGSDVVTEHVEQQEAPPNQVRIDNDLPVTVLAKDHMGRQIEKKVKYGKDRRAVGEVKDDTPQPPIHGNTVVPVVPKSTPQG